MLQLFDFIKQALYVLVFANYFSFKRFYWYIKLLQSSTVFKPGNKHEVPCNKNFCTKFFTIPHSKNIVATLRLVTIENLSWHSFLYYNSMIDLRKSVFSAHHFSFHLTSFSSFSFPFHLYFMKVSFNFLVNSCQLL